MLRIWWLKSELWALREVVYQHSANNCTRFGDVCSWKVIQTRWVSNSVADSYPSYDLPGKWKCICFMTDAFALYEANQYAGFLATMGWTRYEVMWEDPPAGVRLMLQAWSVWLSFPSFFIIPKKKKKRKRRYAILCLTNYLTKKRKKEKISRSSVLQEFNNRM